MIERLQTALTALRYEPTEKPTVRINLLFCIMAHAIVRADEEMQAACDAEMKKIRASLPVPPPPIVVPPVSIPLPASP